MFCFLVYVSFSGDVHVTPTLNPNRHSVLLAAKVHRTFDLSLATLGEWTYHIIRRTIFKDTTKIRQNHRYSTLCLLFIISGAPKSLVFLAYRSRNPGLVSRYCDRCDMYCRKFVAPVFWLCVARTVHMEASACATRVSSTD